MVITVDTLSRDEGTVLYFEGHDEDGCPIGVVVDHRMGRAIVEALASGPVTVDVEPFQVYGHAAPVA